MLFRHILSTVSYNYDVYNVCIKTFVNFIYILWTNIYFVTFRVVSVTNDSEYSSMWIVQYCSVQQWNVSAVRYQPANRAPYVQQCSVICHFVYWTVTSNIAWCWLWTWRVVFWYIRKRGLKCGLHKQVRTVLNYNSTKSLLVDVEWITILIVIETKDFVGFRLHTRTFENIG